MSVQSIHTDAPEKERSPKVMEDEELQLVSGGQQFVFRGDSFSRDSWFVAFMIKLLIQGNIRQEFGKALDSTPQEITVEGRTYRVSQLGNTIYVEEVTQQ